MPTTSSTEGIEQLVADINNFFNGRPDNRLTAMRLRSATTGVMEATFSELIKLPDGKTLAATGKKVKMPMAIIARWKKGYIAEKHLFWDNAEYMKQWRMGQ